MTIHLETPEVADAIHSQTQRLLEQVMPPIKGIESIEDVRELLADLLQVDGTEAIDLSLGDQVSLIEDRASELDLEIGGVSPDSLRIRIEELACHIVARLGVDRATEMLCDLECFMNLHEFEVVDMVDRNYLGSLPHQCERSEGDCCTVLEYRCIEGLNVDVYEYRVGSGITFYFEKRSHPS
jgi:hypothetical protein